MTRRGLRDTITEAAWFYNVDTTFQSFSAITVSIVPDYPVSIISISGTHLVTFSLKFSTSLILFSL
jgi:hypothetical protein